MRKLLYLLALLSFSTQAQNFQYNWTEGDGTISIPTADLANFAISTGRVEVDFTPRIVSTTGVSQRILTVPNENISIWVYNDGVHGRYYNDVGEERLFRTRWGLVSPGIESKIVITWDNNGYAVLVDGILRIHDWQTIPQSVPPDSQTIVGVYGSRIDGSNPATGSFTIRVYDTPISYDPCTVDIVGTINEGLPNDNSGDWSQGIDPSCSNPDPDPCPWDNTITIDNPACVDPDPDPNPQPVTDVNLTWTNATQNTDGTTIPATGENSLINTIVYWGACLPNDTPAEPWSSSTIATTIPGQEESTTVEVGTPGRWCFQAKHTNQAGLMSDFSEVKIKEIGIAMPAPPDSLRVEDGTVYYVVQQPNAFLLLAVGTVPADTACISTQSVNNEYYAVPTSEVTWSGTVRPLIVMAKCY